MARKGDLRIRSVRSWRRILEEATQRARRGELPWSEVTRVAAAAKTGAELIMAENILRNQGIDDAEVNVGGVDEDGGLETFDAHKRPKTFVKKRVVRKTGQTPKGKVDETQVSLEGAEADVDEYDLDDEDDTSGF